MTKTGKKIIRYSNCFKLQVVEEIEKNGLSVEDCRRKYGIGGGQTIKKLGKHHLSQITRYTVPRLPLFNVNCQWLIVIPGI